MREFQKSPRRGRCLVPQRNAEQVGWQEAAQGTYLPGLGRAPLSPAGLGAAGRGSARRRRLCSAKPPGHRRHPAVHTCFASAPLPPRSHSVLRGHTRGARRTQLGAGSRAGPGRPRGWGRVARCSRAAPVPPLPSSVCPEPLTRGSGPSRSLHRPALQLALACAHLSSRWLLTAAAAAAA